ncbi:MAG: hypothetical protein R3Y59_02035 [bacterium]
MSMKFTTPIFCMLFAISLSANAQDESADKTAECRTNTSLFTESAKVKNYADALEPWEMVYRECPTASRNIYLLGWRILQWQMTQTTDAAEIEAIFQRWMKLYDDQMEYFAPTDADKARVLATKAYYYEYFKPTDKATVYAWYKDIINTLQEETTSTVLQQYFVASNELYKADNSLAEQFINDYTMVNAILTTNSAPDNSKADQYTQSKSYVDVAFATSGVADCDKMNEIFLPNVENNKENLAYLESTLRLFKRLKCTGVETYFNASTYSYNIKPTPESATGLGNMCYGKNEFENAIQYYTEAVELSKVAIEAGEVTEEEGNKEIANNLLLIAQSYFKSNRYSKTREYCKESLKWNPNQGAPYLILGTIYADARGLYEDATLAKSIYWVVVDQFVKAKNVDSDPNIVEQANKMINAYRGHFPSNEEIFMHPELTLGNSFFVGGWVSESTTIRAK